MKNFLFYYSRNPFLYSGHFNKQEIYFGRGRIGMSQSLLLFRAFQHKYNLSFPFIIEYESQSLLLFRAFQLNIKIKEIDKDTASRNPFFYSGHFNLGAILVRRVGDVVCRNPFFYSGHFNKHIPQIEEVLNEKMSQSLLLFRAFQLSYLLEIDLYIFLSVCRNPFFYSGHFNCKGKGRGSLERLCRNPFFYSGHFNSPVPLSSHIRHSEVAIPSFIQGIST